VLSTAQRAAPLHADQRQGRHHAPDFDSHLRQRPLLLVVRSRLRVAGGGRAGDDGVHVHTERATSERLLPGEGLAGTRQGRI